MTVNRNVPTVAVHVRTDPIRDRDLFYDNAFGIADEIADLFIPRMSASPASQQVYVKVREIWPFWTDGSTTNTYRVTFNSPFGAAFPSYSLTFLDRSTDGTAQTLACRTLGQTFGANSGGDQQGPILLNLTAINGSAPCGPQSIPPAVLKAQVIAHEAGHKLGLRHTSRLAYWDPAVTTANLPGLAADRFAHEATPDFLYLRLQWSAGVPLERPGGSRGALAGILQDWILADPGYIHQHSPTDRVSAFGIPDSIIDLTQPMFIEIPSGHIMDWTPDPITALNLWFFQPGELLQLCIRTQCP